MPWYANPELSDQYKIYKENGEFKSMDIQQLYQHYNYVILDDDDDMLLEQKDHFINTDGMIGLTDLDVSNAIKILNKES